MLLFPPFLMLLLFFFFNDTATTEIYTLSLHDALPICQPRPPAAPGAHVGRNQAPRPGQHALDRKSTRLNSSHQIISYAVFCLKKKKVPHVFMKIPRIDGYSSAREYNHTSQLSVHLSVR